MLGIDFDVPVADLHMIAFPNLVVGKAKKPGSQKYHGMLNLQRKELRIYQSNLESTNPKLAKFVVNMKAPQLRQEPEKKDRIYLGCTNGDQIKIDGKADIIKLIGYISELQIEEATQQSIKEEAAKMKLEEQEQKDLAKAIEQSKKDTVHDKRLRYQVDMMEKISYFLGDEKASKAHSEEYGRGNVDAYAAYDEYAAPGFERSPGANAQASVLPAVYVPQYAYEPQAQQNWLPMAAGLIALFAVMLVIWLCSAAVCAVAGYLAARFWPRRGNRSGDRKAYHGVDAESDRV